MSKSLGTGTDPIVLIEKYGADSTRFGLIYQMMGGQDIHFNEDHVLAGKKFCNKIWNISRFVLTQIGNSKIQITNYKQIQKSKLQKENKEILDKLEKTIKTVNKDLNQYKFGQALHTIYDFTWHDFADNYIEYSKNSKSEETLYTLYLILNTVLILLHPFMPFITEEIWGMIPNDLRCRWNTDIVSRLLIIEKWVS